MPNFQACIVSNCLFRVIVDKQVSKWAQSHLQWTVLSVGRLSARMLSITSALSWLLLTFLIFKISAAPQAMLFFWASWRRIHWCQDWACCLKQQVDRSLRSFLGNFWPGKDGLSIFGDPQSLPRTCKGVLSFYQALCLSFPAREHNRWLACSCEDRCLVQTRIRSSCLFIQFLCGISGFSGLIFHWSSEYFCQILSQFQTALVNPLSALGFFALIPAITV